MKVVFDTNILLSATLWDGSAAQKLLFQCIRKEIQIYSSLEILSEYQKVLERDFGYTSKEIEHIMEKVFAFITLIKPAGKVYAVKDDPDDNKIIECAVESDSQYIITYDNHLLKIAAYQGIKIIKPEEAMKNV